MTTTFTLGSYDIATDNETAPPLGYFPGFYVLQNTIDFSKATVTSDGDEIVEAINIPAKTLVLAAWFNVITVDAGCTDVDVGFTGGDVDGLIDGATFATAGIVTATPGVLSFFAGGTYGQGVWLTAADTLDIEINSSDTVTAKVTLYALCFTPHA
jgi:hypothetical protein